jgi:hypothetical protein
MVKLKEEVYVKQPQEYVIKGKKKKKKKDV